LIDTDRANSLRGQRDNHPAASPMPTLVGSRAAHRTEAWTWQRQVRARNKDTAEIE